MNARLSLIVCDVCEKTSVSLLTELTEDEIVVTLENVGWAVTLGGNMCPACVDELEAKKATESK